MSIDSQITPSTDTNRRPKLRGGWLVTARVFWVLLTLLQLGLMVYGLSPLAEETLVSPAPPLIEEWTPQETLEALSEAGITTQNYLYFFVLLEIIFLLIYGSIGLVIFLRRSHELIGLLTSFVLVTFGIQFSDAFIQLPYFVPQLGQLILILENLMIASLITFLLVFPDGRSVPTWALRAGIALVLIYAGVRIFGPASFSGQWNQGFGALLSLAIWGLPAYSQWYRFRNKPDPMMRQQIKWLAFSLVGTFLGFLLMFVAIASIPWLIEPGGAQIILHIVLWSFIIIPLVMIPISIGIAITRYRLWDIDIIINRSIVYGLLTLFLVILFLGGFFAIRALLHTFFGADQPVFPAILSTLIVTALFSPTRSKLRHYVDLRLYGIDIDYSDVSQQKSALATRSSTVEKISQFGKYRVMNMIGRGGMGEVYLAKHPDTGQNVAIKTLYLREEWEEPELGNSPKET